MYTVIYGSIVLNDVPFPVAVVVAAVPAKVDETVPAAVTLCV